MGIGKYLKKHFQGKEVEFFIQEQSEWLLKTDSTLISHIIFHVIVVDYDEECGVVIFSPIYDKDKRLYVSEGSIVKFWEPGLNIMKSATNSISGQKLYEENKRDFM